MVKIKWYATTKLKDKRESLGFTQKQMAEYIALNTGWRLSESLYQKWELAQQNIPSLQVVELGKMLEIETGELVEQK